MVANKILYCIYFSTFVVLRHRALSIFLAVFLKFYGICTGLFSSISSPAKIYKMFLSFCYNITNIE